MSYSFVEHTITKRASPDLELPVANCTHPSRAHWRNNGIAFYKENFGEADFVANSRTQFGIPLPPDSPATRAEMRTILRKLQVGFALNGLKTGRRSTHMAGPGAKGTITILPNKDLPETDFFVPGRTFPCLLRHSNAAFIDDAGNVPRGASLKFSDQPAGGPLDLIFNSGVVGEIFFDLRNFWDFTMARMKVTPTDWESQRQFMRKYPASYLGAIEAHREGPSSFADLMYASKIAMAFKAKDGKRRYLKYRLLRPDLEKESGLMSDDRQKCAWFMARNADDDRPRDYLRTEFPNRVKAGLEYVLQFQIWDWDDDRDTHEVFNLCRLWDEATHPWLDVARVQLTEPLSTEDTERIKVAIIEHPDCLGVPDAHNICDSRSLAWARANVYPWSGWARGWRWMFGLGPNVFPAKDEMIDAGPGGAANPAQLTDGRKPWGSA